MPAPNHSHLLKPMTKVAIVGDGCRRRRLERPRGVSGSGGTGGERCPLRQDGRLLDRLRDIPPDVRSPEVQGHGVVPAGALQAACGLAAEAISRVFSCRPAGGSRASLFRCSGQHFSHDKRKLRSNQPPPRCSNFLLKQTRQPVFSRWLGFSKTASENRPRPDPPPPCCTSRAIEQRLVWACTNNIRGR